MEFPSFVSFTLESLERNGFSAYLVGGCVRDSLMGISPHDYDVTTNATPEQIQGVFSDMKTLDVGKKHGTISLVFESGDIVEVTTYRIDGEYCDSRHPENVSFTDKIELDLARRDFTVNAIAFSPTRGFVDVFSGREDIERKRIVCVGNASLRFDEDALRILRAIRFSSKLGFDIEQNTKRAIFQKKELLLNIATERINAELCSLVGGKYSSSVIAEYIDVIRVFLPEIEAINKIALEKAKNESLFVKFCVLFSNISCDLMPVLKRLKFDTKTAKGICEILAVYKENKNAAYDRIAVKKIASRLGVDLAKSYFALARCMKNDKSGDVHLCEKLLCSLVKENCCISVGQLCVDGNDIIENIDIDKRKIGKILQGLLDDVLEERTLNEKKELLCRAAELAKTL